MALAFTDLISPGGSGTDASAYVTASMAPTADRLVVAFVQQQVLVGTSPASPSLSGGGVNLWTAGPTIALDSRRLTTYHALTGGTPTSGAVTIDFAGVLQNACAYQFVEIAGSLLTGTNGDAALVQSDTFATAAATTAIDLDLATAWAAAANQGLAFFYSNTTGHTFTMTGSGFTQLGIGSVSGRVTTAFYGRDADLLSLDATASGSSGTKMAIGLEIAASVDASPDPFAYPRVRLTGLNGRIN